MQLPTVVITAFLTDCFCVKAKRFYKISTYILTFFFSPRYQLLWHICTTLLCFQIKHLLNLTDKNLLRLRTPIMKKGQIKTLPEARETWKHVVEIHNSLQMFFFYYICFKNQQFCNGTRYGFAKKVNFLLHFLQLSIG